MIGFAPHTRVYLALGPTDMRKQIDGLAVLVEDVLAEDPLSSHLFVFCNRARDKIKILFCEFRCESSGEFRGQGSSGDSILNYYSLRILESCEFRGQELYLTEVSPNLTTARSSHHA